MRLIENGTATFEANDYLSVRLGNVSKKIYPAADQIDNFESAHVVMVSSGRRFVFKTSDKHQADACWIVPADFQVWSESAGYEVHRTESKEYLLLLVSDNAPVTLRSAGHEHFYTIINGELREAPNLSEYDLKIFESIMIGPKLVWEEVSNCYSFHMNDWVPLTQKLDEQPSAPTPTAPAPASNQ